MVTRLAPLVPAGELYDYHGPGGVPLWSPYQQGDVFAGITTLGLPATPEASQGLVMLFMHPCTMREGARVRELLTVIQVKLMSAKKVLDDPDWWENRNKVMPLPDLDGGGESTHFADFMEISTIPSALLLRTQRIAQLSAYGRVLMQQRIVFHLTRYPPHPDDLAASVAHIEVEAQNQADWVEAGTRSLNASGVQLPDVERLEGEFQAFLDDERDGSSLRSDLLGVRRSEAVRTIQREIAARFPS